MQQTEKYHFNIIDPSDNFSPDALNDNAQKLETALNQHEAAVDAALSQHKSETTAALSQHKSETTAALAAQKKEWQAADTTLSQTITAVEKGAKLVHLGGPLTGAGTISLAGVDMTQYRALLVFAYVNNVNNTAITNLNFRAGAPGATIIWIYNMQGNFAVHGTSVYASSSGDGLRTPFSWNSGAWSTLNRLECTSALSFIDLYGIKV